MVRRGVGDAVAVASSAVAGSAVANPAVGKSATVTSELGAAANPGVAPPGCRQVVALTRWFGGTCGVGTRVGTTSTGAGTGGVIKLTTPGTAVGVALRGVTAPSGVEMECWTGADIMGAVGRPAGVACGSIAADGVGRDGVGPLMPPAPLGVTIGPGICGVAERAGVRERTAADIAETGVRVGVRSAPVPPDTTMIPPHTEQRARTPVAGTLAGSTRKTERQSGQETVID